MVSSKDPDHLPMILWSGKKEAISVKVAEGKGKEGLSKKKRTFCYTLPRQIQHPYRCRLQKGSYERAVHFTL